MPLEEMGSFFNSRIDEYEEHMKGIVDCYRDIAGLIPSTPDLNILDLGCGTGLELDEIFKVNPSAKVTGIDLAEKLLEKLREKHAARENQLNLILGDYFEVDFGENVFDIAISVQTLHHFSREAKTGLYIRIIRSLKPNGFYIETDYVAPDQEFEDFHITESKRLRAEQGIGEGYYHYDTPFTEESQMDILKESGFSQIEKISKHGNSVTLVARR